MNLKMFDKNTSDTLNHATFRFIDCNSSVGMYGYKGNYDCVTVGGIKGLLNALMDMKPKRIVRLT